jgi:hypothetical protein
LATYTSSQSGNFSASATWGGSGPPADGDAFNVSSGHTVTIDSGITQPTNGYHDSYVYGVLKNDTSANTELRMNGRLYIKGGGLLHINDNNGACTFDMKIKGTSGEAHGLWHENEDEASLILEGADGMPSTTLASAPTENATSLSFTDASDFAVGEWFAVFDNSTAQTSGTNNATSMRDEGFVVHDISSNTVYFRHFVGPDDVTVSSYSGSTLTVSNAKKFRKGQYVIVGTGSNRTAGKITGINYTSNEITLSVSITGNPTGATLYLTGTEKPHASGDKVRKVATMTTTSSGTGTTITVADATQFAAGDTIWIASPWESSIAYYNDYSSYLHTVSSVSGNSITLSSAPSYSVLNGVYVTRVSRNITIGGASTDDHVFYYSESYTSNYNRINIQKDVHFKDIGNTSNNNYGGWTLRGYFNSKASLKSVTMTQTVPANDQAPWTEGVTATFLRQRDHNGLWQWSVRYSKLRCCFAHNAYNNYHPYWHDGNGVYNCISSRSSNLCCRAEGQRNNNEIAYNYFNRQNYGLRVTVGEYEAGFGIHHNIFDAFSHYASNVSSGVGYGIDGLYCNDFRGPRYGHYTEGGATHLYSRTQEAVSAVVGNSGVGIHGGTNQAGSTYQSHPFRSTKGYHNVSTHLEWDFEVDLVAQYGYNCRRVWDVDNQAWAFRKRNSTNSRFGTTIYLPPNSTLRVSLEVKLDVAPQSEYPKLQVLTNLGQQSQNRLSNSTAGNTRFSSERITVNATSASIGAYEELQVTYPARDYGATVNIIWGQQESADDYGFYHKDPIIRIDTPYEQYMWVANSSQNLNFVPDIRNSFTQQKKRLGGRIK